MITVIGAVAVDLVANRHRFRMGTSNPARISLSLGGVGYRIFRGLRAARSFISAVGSDLYADWIEEMLAGQVEVRLFRIEGYSSACYTALMEAGELLVGASDMQVVEEGLNLELLEGEDLHLGEEDLLVLEANLSPLLAESLVARYSTRTRCVFEAVSVEKLLRHSGSLKRLRLLSANEDELAALLSHEGIRPSDSAVLGFLQERSIESLLVARGRRGTSLFQAGQRRDFEPGQKVRSEDTTGAGDLLLAEVLNRLHAMEEIEDAVPAAMRTIEKLLEEGRL